MLVQSQRLFLRRAEPADAPDFLRLDLDPDVMRFVGGVSPTACLKSTSAALTRLVERYERRPGLGVWPCSRREDGAFVGWFMLQPASIELLGQNDEPADERVERIELGYRLARECWGRGLATEMSKRLVAHAFDELKLSEVWAVTAPQNLRSTRVLDKVGFRFRGLARYKQVAEAVRAYSISKPR